MSLLLGLISALAPAPAAVSPAALQPIVVTGERIRGADARLRECIARRCPPNEEIDASLALAEMQLLDGKYHDARKTLLAALGRNKRVAAQYPIPVSDLYRANGRVAANLGLDTDYYQSTWGIYRTLKYGLPPDDVRQFSALMEVAEMMYRTYGHERARLYYESAARHARRAGRPDIAALAELRSAIRHLPPDSVWQVNAIKRIASMDGPQMRAPVLEAKLALARMAYVKHDEQGAQAILNGLAALKLQRPILIYSPPYEMAGRDTDSVDAPVGQNRSAVTTVGFGGVDSEGPGGIQRHGTLRAGSLAGHGPQSFSSYRETPVVDDMWVDIAFRITPEGRVADAKVVRSHGSTFWAQPLLASLKGRRYTPGDPASPTSARLERYTYTSGYERKTNTRAEARSPNTRVEYIDLSDSDGLTVSD